MKSLLVFQQRGEVIEKNPRLRIVRHLPDQFLQIVHSSLSCLLLLRAARSPNSSTWVDEKTAVVLRIRGRKFLAYIRDARQPRPRSRCARSPACCWGVPI